MAGEQKMLISVKKVFDAGIKQIVKEQYRVDLKNVSLLQATPPLRFLRAVNATTVGVLDGLSVERLTAAKKARVRANINVPLRVEFADAQGDIGYGEADIILPQDVILSVPEPSIIPYALEAITSAAAAKGDYIGEWSFSLDVLITLIIKVVIDADILVPTFGYAEFSPIQNYENIGSGFFDLPLYPDDRSNSNKRNC